MEILNKAKELLGHVKPGMSTKELMVLMAEIVIKTKDPAREVRVRRKADSNCGEATQNSTDRDLVVKKLSHSCSASANVSPHLFISEPYRSPEVYS